MFHHPFDSKNRRNFPSPPLRRASRDLTRARRCVELGFAFANALEDQVVAGALEKFQPDLTVRAAR